MKRITMLVAAAAVAALTMGVITGCSSQPASSAASASGSASASASAASSEAVEQSQDEIIAELKEAIAKAPTTYKSVTVTEEEMTWSTDEAVSGEAASSEAADSGEAAASAVASSEAAVSSEAAASEAAASGDPMADAEVLKSTSVYKFDASGDKLKTELTAELGGIKLQYLSDGDDAVCVTDGPVYGGTTEQFDLSHFKGYEVFFAETIGDPNAIVGCIDTVTKDQLPNAMTYELTLDPEKYMATDEFLEAMVDSGSGVKEAVFTFGFDSEGRMTSATKMLAFDDLTSVKSLSISDFDSTAVGEMPKADKTYEEMDADMQAKIDALVDEPDSADASADEAASSEAAKTE